MSVERLKLLARLYRQVGNFEKAKRPNESSDRSRFDDWDAYENLIDLTIGNAILKDVPLSRVINLNDCTHFFRRCHGRLRGG